jgi:hypothetical protein
MVEKLRDNQVPKDTVELALHLIGGAIRLEDKSRLDWAFRILGEDCGITLLGYSSRVETCDLSLTENNIWLRIWDGGFR